MPVGIPRGFEMMREAVSFERNFTGNSANAAPACPWHPFQTQMVSGFRQLKMARRQLAGGGSLHWIILRAASGMFFAAPATGISISAVHNLIRDAAATIQPSSACRSRAMEYPSGSTASVRIARPHRHVYFQKAAPAFKPWLVFSRKPARCFVANWFSLVAASVPFKIITSIPKHG